MLVGRVEEVQLLMDTLTSPRSELVVVHGRRRIGKTYLIRSTYRNDIRFELTGMYGASLKDQLKNFHIVLGGHRKGLEPPADWLDAFHQLGVYIASLRGKRKKVIFIDEFPWLDSRRSRFLAAFGNFWNTFASKRNDILVVICGSAASYMIQKIIRNKGGLHNRITQHIQLAPFDLHEAELLLKHNGVVLTRYDQLCLYMALGGVPYYLQMVKKGESTTQAIDRLCFRKNGALRTEFMNVFVSLFEHSDNHERIVRVLAQVRKGLTRNQVAKKSKVRTGGTLTKTLQELEVSGFLQSYMPYKGVKDPLYRLSDEYALFYLKFIEPSRPSKGAYWSKLQGQPSYRTWSGFTFETICMKHVDQIKKGLGISGIHSVEGSWLAKSDASGAQVDLLIDRDDNVIDLCEMKFVNGSFSIDKKYARSLTNKVELFRTETGTRKSIFITFVSTYGLSKNPYSKQMVRNELTMDALFEAL